MYPGMTVKEVSEDGGEGGPRMGPLWSSEIRIAGSQVLRRCNQPCIPLPHGALPEPAEGRTTHYVNITNNLFHALVALACQSLDHDRNGLKIVG